MYLNDSEPELNIIIFLPHVITVSILFFSHEHFYMTLYHENEEHILKRREWPSEIAK